MSASVAGLVLAELQLVGMNVLVGVLGHVDSRLVAGVASLVHVLRPRGRRARRRRHHGARVHPAVPVETSSKVT